MKKLSVITVNYNNLEGLKKTFESVRSQSFTDYEWLVIDGGSTDGSKAFLEAHQAYFTYWCSEPDKGVYDAMNKGVRLAKGEYVSFMNSGDCFADDAVLAQVFSLSTDADVCYGHWVEVSATEEVTLCTPPTDLRLFNLFYSNLCHQAMFIRLRLLQASPYDLRYPVYADWAKWLQLMLEGCRFAYVPVTVCRYDKTGISAELSPKLLQEQERFRAELIPQAAVREALLYAGWLAFRSGSSSLEDYVSDKYTRTTYALVGQKRIFRMLISGLQKMLLPFARRAESSK